MTTFPTSPHLLKGGLELVGPVTCAIQQIIALENNLDPLARMTKAARMLAGGVVVFNRISSTERGYACRRSGVSRFESHFR
jgi:hypothetical protein